MKMYRMFFVAAAVAVASSVACSKINEVTEPEVIDNPGDNPGENPGEEPDADVPEGMIRLCFAVSSENGAAPQAGEGSRTSWDGTSHDWSEGDQIRILWGEGESDYVDAEVVDGKVTANVVDADYYYAVYPTTAGYALDLTEGEVTITVPRYQSGSFADANIMAAKTGKEAAAFNFKNMTSILKFTTGSTYSYNSASFMVNDKSIKLTGEVHTTFPAEFSVTTSNTVMKEDIVCIQPNNPTGNPGMSANTTYYLAMLPGESVDNGIGFKIEKRVGSSVDLVAGGISKSSFNRERSKVYDLGTLDSRIVTDWYISETGTGNGASAGTPAAPERLMDLLNPSYSTQNTTAGWRLANATIHVAAGTYNLQALNGGAVFDPHYNLGGLVAHVKGEGTALNPTNFVCNEADGDHIFAVTGTNRVGNFTFENITFTATNSFATNGIAFYLTSTGANNVITFKDCTFTGLTSTVSSGSGYGGAAVNIYDSAAYDVIFNGCTFSGNTAVRGGAVALTNGGENSNVSFTGCTFSNNVASSNQGGALYVYASGHTTFDSTSFSGDGSTSQAANGGAIAIIAGATVTLQNGCSFNGCVTNGSGGAIFNHGTLIADGTTFSSCKAKLGGAIHTDGSATIGETTACTFTNNTASQNGGAIHFQKTSSGAETPALSVSNSSFSGDGETVNAALKGGAIAATSTAYEYTISNCSFSNLVSENGGAIHNIGIGTVNNGSTFTACDVTVNGGAIYNGGTLTLDGSTITGKGKEVIMSALLGGGLYNADGAICTIQNNSIIEQCALDAGSEHGGAGIWNAGTLSVTSSTLRNNHCGYRGGAIYCTGSVSFDDTSFSGNNAANGGAIHTFAGADCYIKNSTFTANTATNGAALRTLGASGNISKLVVFNSLFKDNVPSSKTGNNGGAVQLYDYSYSVIANTTISSTNGNALATNGSASAANPYFYLLSCTFADNTTVDFDRNYNRGWFYNTICASAEFSSGRDNQKKAQYYSIFGSNRFGAGGTTTPAATVTDLGKNCLGTYSSAAGVYPLSTDATYSAHYTQGMSVADLQALTFTNITLTEEQTALLAKDQKGNTRTGTIMGAYVLTE